MGSLAHFFADTLNYLFLGFLLIAPISQSHTSKSLALHFWLLAAFGIGLGIICAEVGKNLPIWPGDPNFPSGHETVTLGSVTVLATLNLRWLFIGLPLSLLMGWALVQSGFHTPIEVSGALITGPLPVLFVYFAMRILKVLPKP